MSAVADQGIVLSGPPRSVTGRFPLPVSRSTVIPVSITVGRDSTVYRAVLRPAAKDASELRLRLADDTPPGTYGGEATIDGEMRKVSVEVEPLLRLRIQPQQTRLTAAATSSVEFELTMTNGGNVPFDVPKADTFDLDDADGQERALGKTLRATLAQGEQRVDRLFEELRESHGGEARLAVRRGAGRLQPGESRAVTCLLDVPATAKQGRSYMGAWPLGNTALVIVADITAGAKSATARTKA